MMINNSKNVILENMFIIKLFVKIAEALNNCRPVEGKPCHLYAILLNMNCPVPEEQNTRGRRIHPPEESTHGFGIITTKCIPSVSKYIL